MKIVLLLGASCTGKSTLCKELSTEHQWKVADTDEFYYKLRNSPSTLQNVYNLHVDLGSLLQNKISVNCPTSSINPNATLNSSSSGRSSCGA